MSGLQLVKQIDPTAIVTGGLVPKGAYSGATTYAIGDCVSYLNSSYVCILSSTGNVPTNASYWQLIAAQGSAGPTGATGPTGVTASTGAVYYVKDYGATGNGSTDDGAAIALAIAAASAGGGGAVFFPAGAYKVTSSARSDTVSYRSGNTFNDVSCVTGDIGKYVLWANLGRVSKITGVVAGSYFTVDVLPTTTAATTALIVTPGIVIPEGVKLVGAGSNFNQQPTAGSSTSTVCTQVNDAGTGVTILIQGANSVSGNSTRFGLSNMSVLGSSSNKYGLYVGNGAWLIDSNNLELSNHGVAGLALDGNINSHSFYNLVLYGNGSASASGPTGGVVTHPYNAGGSASCNFYNPFFTSNYGFGICDGDVNGSYGVVLYSPQFNSQQASAMANSGTSMVLQSKNTGDGMASVYGGWSESAALYDIITSGYVTVIGTRMHSTHAYHWIVTGGIATAIACTFEGASTYTANITGGVLNWFGLKCSDPGLYSGAPTTLPALGSSGTVFGNALTANGITNTGDFTVKDAATATKAMRFQTSGASLDMAFAGSTTYLSNWTGAGFTGTQVFYMAFDTSGNFDAFKVWRWHDAPFGSTVLTIDPAGTTMTFGEGMNMALGTTTGTKIGTGTNQKLGFYNSTPIVQPTGDIITALQNLGLIATATISEADVTNLTTDLAAKAPLASPTFTGTATFPAGTTGAAPLKITHGTNLTSAVADAIENDSIAMYLTTNTTDGRAHIPARQHFRLTSNGSNVTTIGNFFGSTSNISLVASAYYEIEVVCWFTKTTSEALTWTFTNSAAPTSMNIHVEQSPLTGVVTTAAAYLSADIVNSSTAAQTYVTGSLTTAVNHFAKFRITLKNGTGTSLKIQATNPTGSITPLLGSYWTAIRIPTGNTGTFAA